MPNNDFDKTLQGKLRNYEAGFNPADWQKMEATLPQDSQKPFLFIALLFGFLLLSIGGLIVNHLVNETGTPRNASAMISENIISPQSESSNAGSIISKWREETTNEIEDLEETITSNSMKNLKDEVKGNSKNSRNEKGEADKKTIFGTAANSKSGAQTTGNASGKQQPPGKVFGTSQNSIESMNDKKGRKMAVKNKSRRVNPVAFNVLDISHTKSTDSNEAEFLSRMSAEAISPIYLGDVQESANASPEKKKRKIFEFGLGIGVGTSISFIDANYLSKPGYSAGLSQELMFVNRVGLAFTQSYHTTEYNGGQYPCPAGYVNCPLSYTSSVQSFNIGIDLKINIIYKPRWNWYAKAGIVNVFKLQEIFEYAYTDVDTVTPPPNQSTQTNFSGNNSNIEQDAAGIFIPSAFSPNATNLEPLPDLTISGENRFHLAYHVATGFDVKLNSRLKLQFETGYSFTKPTVGPDDRRLHTVGIDGGIFFLFGK